MNTIERWCIAARHSRWLKDADWLWNRLRPHYDRGVALFGKHGVTRIVNGSDLIRVLPAFRSVTEVYEPQVWHKIASEVQSGDTVVDVGAYIGLYTVALANWVGPSGKVVAFEPDAGNFGILKAHIDLNNVSDRVELVQAAVGDQDGHISFEPGKGSESHLSYDPPMGATVVQCVRLDTQFASDRIDLLKIDVEGYEEAVLRGGVHLLGDPDRCPRRIFIEAHPFAWCRSGTTSASLLGFLEEHGYKVFYLDGQPAENIVNWQEVVACKEPT